MSQTTTAQRHGTRVHLPLTPILAVLATAIIAAAVLILVNQPTTTSTRTETSVGVATAALPAIVPHPETLAMRRHMIEQAQARAHTPPLSRVEWRVMHNHVQGTTLNTFGSGVLSPPAASATGVFVQHQRGKFPGKAR